jgi:hypothetical protein
MNSSRKVRPITETIEYPENDEPIRVKISPFDGFDETFLGRPNVKRTKD